MLEIFKQVLLMTVIGSVLTITLTILRPITERLFLGRWHYNTQKIVILAFIIPIITILNFNLKGILNEKSYSIEKVYTNKEIQNELISNNSQENAELIIENGNSNKDIKSEECNVNNSYLGFTFTNVISMSLVSTIINIWIIGIIVLSLWYMCCYLKVKYDFKKNIRTVKRDSIVDIIFNRCKEKVGIDKEVKVYYSSNIKTPLVIGFFNNIVLIPEDILEYENVNDILCHELTHIKRKDLLIKLIMTFASIVHWFNPFIYILRNNVDMYCELSCDENITMHMSYEDRKKYGESVLRIAENFIGVRRFGNAFGGNKNYIKRRLIMILKSKKQRKVVGIISVAVIAIVLLGSGYVTKGISNKLDKKIVLSSEKENEDIIENGLEEKLGEEKAEEAANNIEIKKEEIVKEPVEDKKSEPKQEQQVQKPQQTIANPIKYRNEKLGIELTIPSYWKDKFTIENTDAGIAIDYICQYDYYFKDNGEKVIKEHNEKRWLFCIEDINILTESELDMTSSIQSVPRYKNIHGKEYVIGGPTDCLDINDPDRPEVDKFLKDIPSIINSMKEI